MLHLLPESIRVEDDDTDKTKQSNAGGFSPTHRRGVKAFH